MMASKVSKKGSAVVTVNLTEIATTFPGRAEIESNYQRLQRFFQHVTFDSTLIAQLVVSFLPYTTYTLAFDRTNWMLGCFPINFLVLSVVHQGIAFPILWTFLPKKGNSNTKERIELLNRFIAHCGEKPIICRGWRREVENIDLSSARCQDDAVRSTGCRMC